MIKIRSGSVSIQDEIVITYSQFPRLLGRHLSSDPLTACVERFARDYVREGFPIERTLDFVSAVCRWGGFPIVWRKVRRDNTRGGIRGHLRRSYRHLIRGENSAALEAVKDIENLNISFGSKHLRFLSPSRAVVFDKKIVDELRYKKSTDGFVEFLDDCMKIRDTLNGLQVAPTKGRQKWRVCDVEMAIFMRLP